MSLGKQNIGNIVELVDSDGKLVFLGKIYTFNSEGNPLATNELGNDGTKLFDGNFRLTVHINNNEKLMFSCVCITYPNGDYLFTNLEPIKSTDKRLSYRLDFINLATVSVRNKETPAMIQNISLSGLKIFTPQPLNQHDVFDITLNFPYKTESIQCTVVRKIDQDVYGIKFVNLQTTNVDDLYNVLLSIRYPNIKKQKKEA